MLRRSLLFSSLGVVLAPNIAWAAGKALAFVVNSGEATVSVIDMAARREIDRVPMLREPHHLVLTPDRKSVVVGDTVGNALFFLDPRTGQMQRRLAVPDPYQLQFSPDGRLLTIAGLARAQVDIFDAVSFTLKFRIPAATLPSHIAYSPDSVTAYVSLQGTDQLMAIATATGQARWTVPVGKTPAGVLWHRGRILVGIMGEAHFVVVNPADGNVERSVATGEGAHTLFPDHSGQKIYVTNRVAGSLSVVNPDTLVVERTLRVPGFPDDLEFAPDGKIWAALRHAQAVGIIDPVSGAIERIKVGRQPHGIWLNTHDGLL